MSLLLEADYAALTAAGLTFEENDANRLFVFRDLNLPSNVYTVATSDVLVVIPPNYPQAGNDMFWTYPRLQRKDGKSIPAVLDPGGGDNRIWDGREFCRWSRHWPEGSSGSWRAGKDDIISIYRRIDWALRHPDCK